MSSDPLKDWDNVRPRRPLVPKRDDADRRFWLGVTLAGIGALIFPWYAYWVDSFLAERGLKAAMEDMQRQSQTESQQMADRLAAAQAQSQADAARMRAQSEVYAQNNRIALVRVLGASSGEPPIVQVQLGNAGIEEARDTICRQAPYWLRHGVSGMTLRVQRARGSEPALDAGVVRCP